MQTIIVHTQSTKAKIPNLIPHIIQFEIVRCNVAANEMRVISMTNTARRRKNTNRALSVWRFANAITS